MGVHLNLCAVALVHQTVRGKIRAHDDISTFERGDLRVLDQTAYCFRRIAVKASVKEIEQTSAIVGIAFADICVPDVIGIHHIGDDGIQHHRPYTFLRFQPLLLNRIAQDKAALAQFFQFYLEGAVTVSLSVHEKRSREPEHHFALSKELDLALLCLFGGHALCPDLIGQLLGHGLQPGERNRFLQRLTTYVIFQFSTRQRLRVVHGTVVMDMDRFLKGILRRKDLLIYHRFAFPHSFQPEEQAVSAVRDAEPTLLAEIHRQVHAKAVLQVYVCILMNGFGICLSLLLERNHEILLLFFQAVVDLDPGPVFFIMDSIGIGRCKPAPVCHAELLDMILPPAFIFAYRNGGCVILGSVDQLLL